MGRAINQMSSYVRRFTSWVGIKLWNIDGQRKDG